jgi:hypothetical protein
MGLNLLLCQQKKFYVFFVEKKFQIQLEAESVIVGD